VGVRWLPLSGPWWAQWTITPAGRRGTVVQPTVPRLTFTLLADVTIHLRARNAAGHHDEQEITVTCQPRGGPKSDWHPKIDRRPFVSGGVLHEKLVSARLPLGRNVCIAELTEESSGHIIHHDSEQGTWNDSGYTTAQVQDDARGTAAGTWVGTRCTSDGPTCAAAISPPAAPSTEPTSSLGVAPTSLPSPARSPSTNTPTPACCTNSTIATAKNRGVEEDPYSR